MESILTLVNCNPNGQFHFHNTSISNGQLGLDLSHYKLFNDFLSENSIDNLTTLQLLIIFFREFGLFGVPVCIQVLGGFGEQRPGRGAYSRGIVQHFYFSFTIPLHSVSFSPHFQFHYSTNYYPPSAHSTLCFCLNVHEISFRSYYRRT